MCDGVPSNAGERHHTATEGSQEEHAPIQPPAVAGRAAGAKPEQECLHTHLDDFQGTLHVAATVQHVQQVLGHGAADEEGALPERLWRAERGTAGR